MTINVTPFCKDYWYQGDRIFSIGTLRKDRQCHQHNRHSLGPPLTSADLCPLLHGTCHHWPLPLVGLAALMGPMSLHLQQSHCLCLLSAGVIGMPGIQLRQETLKEARPWRPGYIQPVCSQTSSLSSLLLLCILCNAFWKQSSRVTLKQTDLHGHCFIHSNLGFSKPIPTSSSTIPHLVYSLSCLRSFFQSLPFAPCFLMGDARHTDSGWPDEYDPWLRLEPLSMALGRVTVDIMLHSSVSQFFSLISRWGRWMHVVCL